MKVLVLTPTFFPIVGGAEVGIHEIFKRFPITDRVTIATVIPSDAVGGYTAIDPTREAAYEVERIRPLNVRSRTLRKILQLAAAKEIVYLWEKWRRKDVDVLDVQFVYPHGLVVLFSRMLGIPVRVSLVGRSDVLRSLSWWRRLHAELVLRAANETVANSPYYAHGTKWANRVHVIPYGAGDDYLASPNWPKVDVLRRSWLRSGGDPLVLLAVQRLAPIKRVDALIAQLEELERTDPGRFTLVIVGTGDERERLSKLAARLPTGAVIFAGYVDEEELPAIYAAADIYVSHSMFETFGVMFAQAMASGLPIVAANTSCIPLVIEQGRSGLLVPPGDSLAFASAVRELADNREARQTMGEYNEMLARRMFRWDNISTEHRVMLGSL